MNEKSVNFKVGGVYNAVYTPPNGNEPVKYEGLVFKGEQYENEDVTLQEFIDGFGEVLFIDPGFIGNGWEFTYLRQAHCVYHVWSGLDAFEVRTGENRLALPYVAIIGSSPEKAREKAALLLGQKLEDQETNPDYLNYVGHAEFKYVHSTI